MHNIFDEKNLSIENIKIQVVTLNNILEEYKLKYDNMKRRVNNDVEEKNKLTRI